MGSEMCIRDSICSVYIFNIRVHSLVKNTYERFVTKEIVIKSKTVETLEIGDQILVQTAGGGGYGYPTERPEHLQRNDIADRKTLDC